MFNAKPVSSLSIQLQRLLYGRVKWITSNLDQLEENITIQIAKDKVKIQEGVVTQKVESIEWVMLRAIIRFAALASIWLGIYMYFPTFWPFFKPMGIILTTGVFCLPTLILGLEKWFETFPPKELRWGQERYKHLNNQPNLSEEEKENVLRNSFFRKFARELRYGELEQIKKSVSGATKLMEEKDLINERILSLKFFFTLPFYRNPNDDFQVGFFTRVGLLCFVIIISLSFVLIAFALNRKPIHLLIWFITRGQGYLREKIILDDKQKGEIVTSLFKKDNAKNYDASSKTQYLPKKYKSEAREIAANILKKPETKYKKDFWGELYLEINESKKIKNKPIRDESILRKGDNYDGWFDDLIQEYL